MPDTILSVIDENNIVYAGKQYISLKHIEDLLKDKSLVVRCKDCAYYVEIAQPCPICAIFDHAVEEDDYCSSGERRD